MSFVNPDTIRKIFAGTPIAQQGAFDPNTPQGQNMIAMLAGAGSGMTQAAGQPGAGFAQAMGGGAQGMMQGQQHAQQQQMGQMQMRQMQQQLERQERISKILGDLTGSRRPDFASQVDAQLPQAPSLTQPQQAQATPLQGRGQISAQYESGGGGVGTVSSGRGDPGGPSYGRHQLSSNAGTMQSFLQSPEGQPFATQFGDFEPGSPQFNQIYQEIAQGAGPQFEQAQQQYLERTHVQPVVEMAQKAGLPVDNPAVQEALYSQAIQHGGQGNMEIINRAMASLGPDAGPEQVIDALYDAREPYAVQALRRTGASEDVIEGVRNRYRDERNQVKAALGERVVQPGSGPGPLAQGQPQQAPQQPQQPMNGYQQTMARRAQEGSIPPQAAELLSLMDPDQAIKALWDMQNPKQGEMPAAVKELMWAFGGDEQAARQAWHDAEAAKAQDDGLTTATQTTRQKAELFKQADPKLSDSEAMNLALGRNRVSRDPVTGQVDIVDIHTGQVVGQTTQSAYQAQDPGAGESSDVDVSLAFGAPAVMRNVVNTVADMFSKDLPRPEVEDAIRRVTSLGVQGDVLLSEQFTGRVSNQLLNMIGELKAKPKTFFEGPARGKTSLEEMNRLIGRDLDRQRRIAADPGQGAQTRREARAAVEALTDYKAELDSVLEAWGSFGQQDRGSGPPAPEGVPENVWNVMTEEERALWLN